MKSFYSLLIAGPVALALLAGSAAEAVAEVAPAPAHPMIGAAPATAPAAPAAPDRNGTVKETMNTAGYTYVFLDSDGEEIWVAGPERSGVTVGAKVITPAGMPMHDFHSNTLDRDFALIYFVNSIRLEGEPEGDAAASPHGGAMGAAPKAAPEEIDVSGIEKAEGGKSLAEIFAEKADLAGKEVIVRGKVVKYTAGVMGRNWLHLRDGTEGPKGENDLTVTSSDSAAVGDTVTAKGSVALDQDFGYGYSYDVLVEKASVTVE